MRVRIFQGDEKELIRRAAEFHGHLGPYMILGLKAGLVAKKALGNNPFRLRAKIKTELKPPKSCFIDGVQFSTSCTFGKGNITIEEGLPIVAVFTNGEKTLEVRVRDEVIQSLNRKFSDDELEEVAISLFERNEEELFEICAK